MFSVCRRTALVGPAAGHKEVDPGRILTYNDPIPKRKTSAPEAGADVSGLTRLNN